MSKPNVFIIESLRLRDEQKTRYEGFILDRILKMGGKDSLYYYIRTKKELIEILKIFKEYDYRYLHFSCHGSIDSINLTLEKMSFDEFGNIIKPYIAKRRIFMSACSVMNKSFISSVMHNSECFSVVGPQGKIRFDVAALMYSSLYLLMFKENEDLMKHQEIANNLVKIGITFGNELTGYFFRNGKYIEGEKILDTISGFKHKLSILNVLSSSL